MLILDSFENMYSNEYGCKRDKINADILSETNAVLSPESAVGIYMANKNVWMENPEYMPMQGYGYCLLDLNFDGVLELINSVNDGSGRYSYNKYYRINLGTYAVEEISMLSDQKDGDYDYYFLGADDTKLLKNKVNNSMFYYCSDFTRVMTGEYGTLYGKVFFKNGNVQTVPLFHEYICEAGIEGNDEKIIQYSYYENDKNIDITETQYNEKVKDFFDENTDLNLSWECISGSEFDKANDSTRKQLLLDAYRSFSYDGFSFNDVATYDITLESANKEPQFDKEKAKQYSMVDYYSMTIDDITELWGSDYTIMNGLVGGGWGGIYYEDNRCPFIFCFESVGIPSSCSGDEVLSGVVVYPEAQDDDFFAIDNIKIVCSHSEVSQKIAGESYTNELYGGQSYSCELENGIILVFTWTNSNTIPSEVSTTFNRTSQDNTINNNENSNSYDKGNQTVEQLRKNIVGNWGLMGDYTFDANGNCYFYGDKNNPGTYKITEDKTLIVNFPWTNNKYTWSELSFDEFHEDHDFDEYFWYITTEGVLRLNGSDYYRDGQIPLN